VHSDQLPSTDELIEALMELGRIGSIDPVVLRDYGAILRAPRVTASTESDQKLVLAGVGKAALLNAIEEIVREEIREAARIALGIHPDFPAQRITHRES
jgi:hypothetical protein